MQAVMSSKTGVSTQGGCSVYATILKELKYVIVKKAPS
jgi:hypothetical protein